MWWQVCWEIFQKPPALMHETYSICVLPVRPIFLDMISQKERQVKVLRV